MLVEAEVGGVCVHVRSTQACWQPGARETRQEPPRASAGSMAPSVGEVLSDLQPPEDHF